MDLRISGNFRPSGRIAARRIQSLFAFYSPVRFCYCAEEFVKRAFDTSDPDAQSSANPVTWIDGVVQHDWGYLKFRSGRTHRFGTKAGTFDTLSCRSYETRATETVKHSAAVCVCSGAFISS